MLALSLFGLALTFGVLQPILARHKSRCGICGHLIVEDEPIVEIDGEWCHEDCVEDEDWEADE